MKVEVIVTMRAVVDIDEHREPGSTPNVVKYYTERSQAFDTPQRAGEWMMEHAGRVTGVTAKVVERSW